MLMTLGPAVGVKFGRVGERVPTLVPAQRSGTGVIPARAATRAQCYLGGRHCKIPGRRTNRLIADFEQAAEAAANRNGPLLARCSRPIRGDKWRSGKVPPMTAREVVVEEVLCGEKVDRGAARSTTHRPLIVDQHSHYPMTRRESDRLYRRSECGDRISLG